MTTPDASDAPNTSPPLAPWSRPFSLAPGELAHFRIGPLGLWIERRPREWRVTTEETRDLHARDLVVSCPHPAPAPIPSGPSGQSGPIRVRRYAFESTSDRFTLEPRLADRSVVVRPEHPLFLLPGARVEVFVSSGVWVVVRLDDRTELLERPAIRPSDTWFGPSPLEGELCYASRTSARLELADLPQRHHRAVTRIQLENRSSEPRRLARLLLPAPELALYRFEDDQGGQLWTQSCELVLDDSGVSQVRFRPGPPQAPSTHPAVLVAPPRRTAGKNLISRALEAIF